MSAGPLFFVHIPKTGGTSLIRALRTFAPAGQSYTEPANNLSRTFTEQLAGAGLPKTASIHGHAEWEACRPFRGRARFITLLREPLQQIASHYLHAVRDPALPQHAVAKALGLKGFLRMFPYNIAYQTHHLFMSITERDAERRQMIQNPAYGGASRLETYFADQLPAVFAFLEEMELVGTLEALDDFVAALAELAGWSHLPRLTHDNAAPSSQRNDAAALLEQLQELEQEPELAPLFAIERASYARARSLLSEARRRRFRARMRDGQADAAVTVHSSPLGEIVLGENFETPEIEEIWGKPSVPTARPWRTGQRQVSRLYVRLRGSEPCRLALQVERLVAVTPPEIMVSQGRGWLPVESEVGQDGMVTLSVPLDCDGNDFREVSLYLQWNRYPDHAPFYPRIRLTSFELVPAGRTGG